MIYADLLHIHKSVELPDFDGDADEIWWNTKTVSPNRGDFRITKDGRLLQADLHYEVVPKEERPHPQAADDTMEGMLGSFEKVVDDWDELSPHGAVYFWGSHDGEMHRFMALFENGRLNYIERVRDADAEFEQID